MTALYIFFVLNPRRDKFPSDGTLSYIHIYSTLPKYLTGQKCNPGEYKFLYTGSFTQASHKRHHAENLNIKGPGPGLGVLLIAPVPVLVVVVVVVELEFGLLMLDARRCIIL